MFSTSLLCQPQPKQTQSRPCPLRSFWFTVDHNLFICGLWPLSLKISPSSQTILATLATFTFPLSLSLSFHTPLQIQVSHSHLIFHLPSCMSMPSLLSLSKWTDKNILSLFVAPAITIPSYHPNVNHKFSFSSRVLPSNKHTNSHLPHPNLKMFHPSLLHFHRSGYPAPPPQNSLKAMRLLLLQITHPASFVAILYLMLSTLNLSCRLVSFVYI